LASSRCQAAGLLTSGCWVANLTLPGCQLHEHSFGRLINFRNKRYCLRYCNCCYTSCINLFIVSTLFAENDTHVIAMQWHVIFI
jgi:hypothetical protein